MPYAFPIMGMIYAVQAEDDHERALTESEAKLADIEARVSSSNACLLHLKREVTPEAALHGDILSMERVLRHLEHNIDGKGAAVDKFTVQAATLKVLQCFYYASIGTSETWWCNQRVQ